MNEGLFTNEKLIAAAREWANDCEWRDGDTINDLTPAEVLAGVERHYEGGLAQFIKDGAATHESFEAAAQHYVADDPEWRAVIEDQKTIHAEPNDTDGLKDRMVGGLACKIVMLRRQLRANNLQPVA